MKPVAFWVMGGSYDFNFEGLFCWEVAYKTKK
jgi:hypothetical protein